MDFLSESTKKERRNLLATGFAGIIVARLKIYPTEIDLVGLKFTSPELPWIAVGALTLVIIYSWAKFVSSFIYESYHAKTQNLFTQIHDGAIQMDVFKKEQELNEWARQLIERRKALQGRIEHDSKRLATLDEEYYADNDDDYNEFIKALDREASNLQEKRARLKDQKSNIYTAQPAELIIEDKLEMTTQRRKELDRKIETDRKRKLEELNMKKQTITQGHELEESEMKNLEDTAVAKNNTILKWKKAHKTERMISPFHSFLEVYLPVFVGLTAIASLVWLLFHFTEPIPPSLPNF